MSDLVTRLRSWQGNLCHDNTPKAECWEAAAEIERLRGLLREAREYLTPANETDEGCDPGECPECDMLRLGLRIDAALADRESAMHTDSVDEATVLPPSPSPSGTPQA